MIAQGFDAVGKDFKAFCFKRREHLSKTASVPLHDRIFTLRYKIDITLALYDLQYIISSMVGGYLNHLLTIGFKKFQRSSIWGFRISQKINFIVIGIQALAIGKIIRYLSRPFFGSVCRA